MRRRGAGRSCAAAALALALAAVPAAAEPPVRVRAAITPQTAQLGERVTYRGTVVLRGGAGPSAIRWARPDSSESLLWGELRPHYARGAAPAPYDTAYVDASLQVFDTGVTTVPGLRFEVQEGSRWIAYRLPVVQMPIVPTVAADSDARLRPLRGPLAAPWWERVPWTVVLGALAILAITFLVWRRLLRRRRPAATATVPRVARADPAAEALRELAALRRLQLPEAGRYADHALALTRILRRFFERTRSTPRPGHTTPELVADLREAGLGEAEVTRIAALLGYWDRLKFARAGSAPGEARDAEDAVEALVRSGAPAARGEAA